jgi:hypothetical protein
VTDRLRYRWRSGRQAAIGAGAGGAGVGVALAPLIMQGTEQGEMYAAAGWIGYAMASECCSAQIGGECVRLREDAWRAECRVARVPTTLLPARGSPMPAVMLESGRPVSRERERQY